MNLPPANVSEALTDGGLPEGWTLDQLQWLAVRHIDLAQRSNIGEWRRRWAFTCHDLMQTIVMATREKQHRTDRQWRRSAR